MKITKIFFGILLLLLSSLSATLLKAQSFYFDKYDVRDGLAQSKVYCFIQDKSGFVWIGTAIGVSKFDGTNFKNYSTESGLSDNGVKSIYMDTKGTIWMGHIGGGVSRYNGSNFEKIQLKGISHDITSITEDASGMLWLSTVGDGVIRIDNPSEPKPSKIIHKQFKGSESLSDFVFTVYKRRNNSLLYITDLGVKTYNEAKKSFEYFHQGELPVYFQVTSVYEDNKENLWFGTYNGGLYKYNEKGGSRIFDMFRDGLASNWISTVSGDKNGNIWVGTWGGGMNVIKGDVITEKFDVTNGLPDNKIWNILEDREGNILIGSNENGLLVYKGKKFLSYSKTDGLINNQVWAIVTDPSDNIWFGTNEGISIYDVKTGKYQHMTTENSRLVSNQIRFLKRDRQGNIWIGTNDYGVQVYQTSRKEFVYDPLINRYFPRSNSLVSAMEIDKDNNLWIGTTEWLVYYEIDNTKIAGLSQSSGVAGTDITTIFCDSKNVVWVGSKRKGLTRIQGSDVKAIKLGEDFTPKTIAEDSEGKLWVGTEDRGILVVKNGKIIKRIKMTDGLLSNNIMSLNVDAKGNVFIGTSAGLNKFIQKTGKLIRYSEKSGFTGIEVKDHATFKDKEGNLWFGTINGAYKYSVKYDIPNLIEPITYISRFRVNSIERQMEAGLSLGYRERSITFDFGSICLSNAEGVTYMYRLVGADRDWITVVDNITMVNYPLLPPGNYTFEVKASNNEGVWNKVPITYSFVINPPFWKTWWFYVILFVVIAGSVYLYIRIRIRTLVKDKRVLEERVRMRTEQVLEEKEKSEALLLNTLPSKVVEELKKFGKTEPEVFENVTVYFSDICSFTDVTSEMDPKVIIDELNDLFTAFDDIMSKHGCERIKTLGDGYMAVCGLPEKDDEHAVKMVRAALEIRDFLKSRSENHPIKWLMRIGINSGKVTGGIVGIRKYLYDIFGDTVNTASRMESNSEPMRINCSESTYNILKGKFRFTEREPMKVKGKGEMKMYFIEEEIK